MHEKQLLPVTTEVTRTEEATTEETTIDCNRAITHSNSSDNVALSSQPTTNFAKESFLCK